MARMDSEASSIAAFISQLKYSNLKLGGISKYVRNPNRIYDESFRLLNQHDTALYVYSDFFLPGEPR